MPGVPMTVKDTDNTTYTGIVTSQTITMDGALHAQTSAELPSDIESTFAQDTPFAPSGRVNIQAIEDSLEIWAQDKIDINIGNITIGGRNMLRNSEQRSAGGNGRIRHGGLRLWQRCAAGGRYRDGAHLGRAER